MKNNKLLFFIGGSYISGLEIVTLHLIRGLKEKGYDVECVISAWNNHDFKERLQALDVPYHEVKLGWIYITKLGWTLDSLIHYPKAFLKCRKIIKNFKPDVYHFCNFSVPILIYPLIKTKAVLNLQESLLPTRKHVTIFKYLTKKVSTFTAVSCHIVKVMENLNIPVDKIKLVYNGIPITDVINKKSNNQLLNIAIIGQVVAWKGHYNLILAIEKLVNSGIKNIKVFIYGNDNTPYGLELKNILKEKKLQDYFCWSGFVKNQEDIYSQCDIVVVPTLTGEPCSLTIIESMSFGKSLIVSDKGGNPELVEDGKNGLIFKADDTVNLYECISRLVNDEELRNKLANNARQKALLDFSYIRMTEQYMDVYKQV